MNTADIGNKNGFSLIELCIVTIISGLLLAAGLKAFNVYMKQREIEQTTARLEKIEDAIDEYVRINGHYPCPAPIDAPPDDTNYGKATNCAAASPSGVAEVSGRGGRRVRIGALPVRTLEIADTYMADGWDRRYTYAVTQRLTDKANFNNAEGGITVIDANGNSVVNGTGQYVLISHGPDGNGAHARGGGEFAPCDANKDHENCDNANAVFRISDERSLGAGSNYYDDFGVSGKRKIDLSEQIKYCLSKMKFYIPEDSRADTDGCVAFIPDCPSGYYATGDGAQFSCRPDEQGITTIVEAPPSPTQQIPACAKGEVLTTNANGKFKCVTQQGPDPLPTCAKGEVLTTNANGKPVCRAQPVPEPVPACAKGEVLTTNANGKLKCVAQEPVAPSCAKGEALVTNANGKLVCKAQQDSGAKMKCYGGGWCCFVDANGQEGPCFTDTTQK